MTSETTHTEDTHVHGENCQHEHEVIAPYTRDQAKIGRNDPCICNSGKKYKKCCGSVA